MGDRCYFELMIAARDKKKAGYSEASEDTCGTTVGPVAKDKDAVAVYIEEESNYGGEDTKEALEESGVPYIAWNDHGCEYEAAWSVFHPSLGRVEHPARWMPGRGLGAEVFAHYVNGGVEVSSTSKESALRFIGVLLKIEEDWGVELNIIR